MKLDGLFWKHFAWYTLCVALNTYLMGRHYADERWGWFAFQSVGAIAGFVGLFFTFRIAKLRYEIDQLQAEVRQNGWWN